jgi:hypothetical protein
MLAGSIRFLRESGAIDKLSSVLSVTDSSSLTFIPGKFLAKVLAPLLADSMWRVDDLARSRSEAESACCHLLALSPRDGGTQVCNNVHVCIHGRTPLYFRNNQQKQMRPGVRKPISSHWRTTSTMPCRFPSAVDRPFAAFVPFPS